MKSSTKSYLIVFLVLSALSISCNDEQDNLPTPEITSEESYVPPGGCPSGWVWDPHLDQCVLETPPTPPTPSDISLSSFSFSSQYTWHDKGDFDGINVKYKTYDGNTINNIVYTKIKAYINNYYTDEIIIGTYISGSFKYLDYHDKNGLFVGRAKYSNNNDLYFYDWTPGFTGDVGGTNYMLRGYSGAWVECMSEIYKNQMFSATPEGIIAGALCIFRPVACLAIVSSYCLVYAVAM